MVGQETSVQALRHALQQQRLHHAYLFSGTRGVGKTTIARIIAKCLNCEQGVTDIPCEQCHHCQAINEGRFVDLFEIDAASRTKVEDTRELLNNVQYRPQQGRYKVYLIDEVHMLSGHSFNALLKTLEEPPAHVVFLLATTDPERLPVTVLSRCLQFHLNSIPQHVIAQHLADILTKESVTFEQEALNTLAISAKGSMRDALSVLDQAIAYGNGHVYSDGVRQMLGLVDQHSIQHVLNALANKNSTALMAQAQQLAEQGADFSQVLTEILTLLHHIALQQTIPTMQSDDAITTLANTLSPDDVQLFYQIALMGQHDLPLAPNPHMGFEMTLLRMLNFCPSNATRKTFDIPMQRETITPAPLPPSIPVQPINAEKTVAPVTPKPVTQKTESASSWRDIVSQLELSKMTRTLAEYTELVKYDNDELVLQLDPQQQALLNAAQQKRLNQACNDYYGKTLHLTINIAKQPLTDCPAAQIKQQQQAAQAQAKKTIESDATVNRLIKQFDARIIDDTVKPLHHE